MSEKWSQERINAHKGYLKAELITCGVWKRKLEHFESSVNRAKNMVDFLEKNVAELKSELAEQGEQTK